MRLLLTSDLHYKLRQYDWLMKAAPAFDVVVVAGDHVDAFGAVPPEVQIAALSATLGALARCGRLLVCSLDVTSQLDQRMAAAALRASLLTYAASPAFQPAAECTLEALKSWLRLN